MISVVPTKQLRGRIISLGVVCGKVYCARGENMPIEIHYDAEIECLCVKLTGKLNMAAIQEGLGALVEAEAAHPECRRLLNDLQEAAMDMNTVEIYKLPQMLISSGLNPNWRRALVVPPAFLQDFKFYETAAYNQGYSVKVFTDRADALKWLTSK